MLNLLKIETDARRASKGTWRAGPNGVIFVEYEHEGRTETDGLAGHMIQADQRHVVNSQPEVMLELVERLRIAEAKVEAVKEYAALLMAPSRTDPKTRYERALRTARMVIGEGLTEHLADPAPSQPGIPQL